MQRVHNRESSTCSISKNLAFEVLMVGSYSLSIRTRGRLDFAILFLGSDAVDGAVFAGLGAEAVFGAHGC